MRNFLAGLLLLAASLSIAGNNAQWSNSGGSLSTAAKTVHAAAVVGGSGFGRIFFDDFENRSTMLAAGNPGWAQDGSRDLPTIVTSGTDGTAPYGGSKMARCRYNGTVAWSDPAWYQTMVLPSWSYSSETFIRLRIRPDSNLESLPIMKLFRWGYPSNKGGILDIYPDTGNEVVITAVENDIPNYPVQYGDNMSAGTWHKLEFYFKNGTTDGAIKVWLDGVLQANFVNKNTNALSGNWFPLFVMSNWENISQISDIYIDNLEIYSDTGTGGTGSMSAGTAAP